MAPRPLLTVVTMLTVASSEHASQSEERKQEKECFLRVWEEKESWIKVFWVYAYLLA